MALAAARESAASTALLCVSMMGRAESILVYVTTKATGVTFAERIDFVLATRAPRSHTTTTT